MDPFLFVFLNLPLAHSISQLSESIGRNLSFINIFVMSTDFDPTFYPTRHRCQNIRYSVNSFIQFLLIINQGTITNKRLKHQRNDPLQMINNTPVFLSLGKRIKQLLIHGTKVVLVNAKRNPVSNNNLIVPIHSNVIPFLFSIIR